MFKLREYKKKLVGLKSDNQRDFSDFAMFFSVKRFRMPTRTIVVRQ